MFIWVFMMMKLKININRREEPNIVNFLNWIFGSFNKRQELFVSGSDIIDYKTS